MADIAKEEAYWREHHGKQPYAKKDLSYDHYAAAYRTGYEGFHSYPGKAYEEIEDDLALTYQRTKAGAALPWDHATKTTLSIWSSVSRKPRVVSSAICAAFSTG